MSTRRDFGKIRRLPSGNYQASYIWPPASTTRVNAPATFQTKGDAAAWLSAQQTDRARGVEQPEPIRRRAAVPTFAEYAERWLMMRASEGLAPGTLREYQRAVRGHLVPALGGYRLTEIKVATVNEWFASYGTRTPATRAKSYRVLLSVMKLAVAEDWIGASPCQIKRGSSDPRRDHHVIVATPEQVDVIADAMPPRLRMLVLLGAYCQLRFGELAELRRADITIDGGHGTIKIRRAMSRVGGRITVGPPKSQAGKRNVSVPPHLVPELAAHLSAFALPGRHGLVFTTPRGGQLYHAVMFRDWSAARLAADLPELHFHDLRHAGITWLARNGATTRERMRRVGHSTPAMVLRYEHADDERDAALADRLSAGRVVVPLRATA